MAIISWNAWMDFMRVKSQHSSLPQQKFWPLLSLSSPKSWGSLTLIICFGLKWNMNLFLFHEVRQWLELCWTHTDPPLIWGDVWMFWPSILLRLWGNFSEPTFTWKRFIFSFSNFIEVSSYFFLLNSISFWVFKMEFNIWIMSIWVSTVLGSPPYWSWELFYLLWSFSEFTFLEHTLGCCCNFWLQEFLLL